MRDRKRQRLLLLDEIALFHEKRAIECAAFGEPEARHHRERAEKLRLVLANIERIGASKQPEP
jgi:hypothetical protein